MNKKEVEAIAILVGTIIGAGVLGIPYVVAKAGFFTGLFVIIFLGIIITLLHLFIGEISLRTKGIHQLTGYAGLYLGKWGKRLMTASIIFGIYGALTAYIIGEGAALKSIFSGNPLIYSLIFFIIASILLFIGLKAVENSEIWLDLGMVTVLFIISVFSFFYFKAENISGFDISKFFIPYGVIFFAFIGTTAIPELREVLKNDKKRLKRAILIGSIISLVLYILFAFVVVGVIGKEFSNLSPNERIASIALSLTTGKGLGILANIFAVFTMSTSFLALGLALKWVLQYDYKINKNIAWALTCFIPLVIAISGLTNFLQILGVVGAIAGGLDGILIVLMHHRAKKLGKSKPAYAINSNWVLYSLMITLFILGVIFTFI